MIFGFVLLTGFENEGLGIQMRPEDGAAVAQARAGDQEAFRVLVERYAAEIFRLGYRMTSNSSDADDVVQETFLRAYRGLAGFEERSNFSTWLHRIAANCSLDLIAKRKRQPQQAMQREDEDDEPLEMKLASGDPGPERLYYSRQMRAQIEAAIARLTPIERTAFLLRHFENWSIDEIGASLHLREGATKNTIHRAVKKLRQQLARAVRSEQ